VENLVPLVEKSFNIIVSEFDSIEMSEREEIRILLVLLEPFEENDQQLSSLYLCFMTVYPFFFYQCYPFPEGSWEYFLESHCKFDIKALKTFRIVELVKIRVFLYLPYPRKCSFRVTG
jgi:hypothetical protein